MKIFISQPMKGKSVEEIAGERSNAISQLTEIYGEFEIIECHFKDIDWDSDKTPVNEPVKFLSRSINLLAEADLVVFLSGWHEARGCRIEESIAHAYGINRMFL